MTTTTRTTDERSGFRLQSDWKRRLTDHYPTMILVVLVLVASIATDSFLTQNNLTNLLSQLAVTGILVLAELVVVISGHIDISVGSALGLAAVLGTGLFHGSSVWVALVVALVTGALIGVVNGTLIAFRGVEAFIVTLGMLALARGLVYWYTQGSPITPKDPSFTRPGTDLIAGIPVIALFWLAAGLIVAFLLRRTVFGRRVYAIGSSKVAATSSGLPVKSTIFMVFVFSGTLCGLAGFLLSARVGAGTPSAGMNYELDAIAAVVIGGARLTGGHGRVFGAVVGTFIFGVITNMLELLDVSTFLQDAFKGALILIAIGIAAGKKLRSS